LGKTVLLLFDPEYIIIFVDEKNLAARGAFCHEKQIQIQNIPNNYNGADACVHSGLRGALPDGGHKFGHDQVPAGRFLNEGGT
jgi:hypothetical protein